VSTAGLERLLADAPVSLRELTIAMPPRRINGAAIRLQRRGHGTNALPDRLIERLEARFVLHRWG
jgi:hypothetical protein